MSEKQKQKRAHQPGSDLGLNRAELSELFKCLVSQRDTDAESRPLATYCLLMAAYCCVIEKQLTSDPITEFLTSILITLAADAKEAQDRHFFLDTLETLNHVLSDMKRLTGPESWRDLVDALNHSQINPKHSLNQVQKLGKRLRVATDSRYVSDSCKNHD